MSKFLLAIFIALCFPVMGQDNPETLEETQKFRIAVNGGYGHRLARLSNDIPQDLWFYSRRLKSGASMGMDATYLVGNSWGLGLKYNRFSSNESQDNMFIVFNDGSSGEGSISDNIDIDFIGPTFLYELNMFNPRHTVYSRLGLGYVGYKDKAVWVNRTFEFTGSTFGYSGDIGYEYAISRRFSLGAQCSLTAAGLSKFKMKDGNSQTTIEFTEDRIEDLTRLDIGAGLKFSI